VSWIVLDASVTLSWCFPDEQTPAAMSVLDLLKAGDQPLVPAFWCSERVAEVFGSEPNSSAALSHCLAMNSG